MSTIHQDFNGYGAYPLVESERLIRERFLGCLNKLRDKNRECFIKAKEEGKEKLLSQVLSVKTRMERISGELERAMSGAHYRFDAMPEKDVAAVNEIDDRIDDIMTECGGMIGSLSCAATDIHLIEHYTHMMSSLGEIEKLFHERIKIFKRMQVYG